MAKAKMYQTLVYLLIALALALSAGIPFAPQAAASPDQATFYSTVDDGVVWWSSNVSYSTAQGASTGAFFDDSNYLEVGQARYSTAGGTLFYVFRGALFFDTSSLPDDATISSAVLSLYGDDDYITVDFLITVVDGALLNEPLVDADYGDLGSQNVSGGSFSTSGFSTSGYNEIALNETGMGWISKTGITKFGLRSSRDIAPTEPTTTESVRVYSFENVPGYRPKLVVTYTTPAPVGGEAYPENKPSILALWIGVCAVAIAGASIVVRRHRAQG